MPCAPTAGSSRLSSTGPAARCASRRRRRGCSGGGRGGG
jgi:hypothetical protein